MHQTKKGNEWHFGMKAHIGVDADSGLVHSVVGTAANVSDVSQAHALLHGHEEEAFADAGYIGVDKRYEMKGKTVKWHVAAKRGKIKAMQEGTERECWFQGRARECARKPVVRVHVALLAMNRVCE